MKFKIAEVQDAQIIHHLMIQAFLEYKDEVPPSSALDETVESIKSDLENGEQAIISFLADKPVGMVRFRLKEKDVYFYRLSVLPEKQGQGIAKKLITYLEKHAVKYEKSLICCKVRMDVPKNITLYESLGYHKYDEEVVHKPNGKKVNVIAMKKPLYNSRGE